MKKWPGHQHAHLPGHLCATHIQVLPFSYSMMHVSLSPSLHFQAMNDKINRLSQCVFTIQHSPLYPAILPYHENLYMGMDFNLHVGFLALSGIWHLCKCGHLSQGYNMFFMVWVSTKRIQNLLMTIKRSSLSEIHVSLFSQPTPQNHIILCQTTEPLTLHYSHILWYNCTRNFFQRQNS